MQREKERLWNKIKCLFYTRVYCQDCGKNITRRGGYITSDSKIYCSATDMKTFYLRTMKDENFRLEDYRDAEEIQEEIKKGRLTKFGKLENFLKR